MDIYPFKTLYIADLNAIQLINNTGNSHLTIIEKIQQTFPELTVWIDAAINTKAKADVWYRENMRVILGSEAFTSVTDYIQLSKHLDNAFSLSLDFLAQGYAGPAELLKQPEHWPKDIIIMTLAKVGTNTGLDIPVIKKIMQEANPHHYYAAGGVRHIHDLHQLQALNVKGALLASALHNKQIMTKDFELLAT